MLYYTFSYTLKGKRIKEHTWLVTVGKGCAAAMDGAVLTRLEFDDCLADDDGDGVAEGLDCVFNISVTSWICSPVDRGDRTSDLVDDSGCNKSLKLTIIWPVNLSILIIWMILSVALSSVFWQTWNMVPLAAPMYKLLLCSRLTAICWRFWRGFWCTFFHFDYFAQKFHKAGNQVA